MKKKFIPVSFFAVLFFCLLWSISDAYSSSKINSTESISQEEFVHTEKASVMYNIGQRGKCSNFDATDSLVFFSYSEQNACVDAFTYDGTYQFTISLAYRDRGSVAIRCINNLLYISSKYGNVFIYDGTQLVEQLTQEQAQEQGLTLSWFQKRTVPIRLSFFKIYRYSDNGEVISKITLPATVRKQEILKYSVLTSMVLIMGITVFYRKRHGPGLNARTKQAIK